MTSKLFLNNITVIDHGFIDNRGHQCGGSFQASFEVSGEVDEREQVVIDFSAVKKSIKQIVDCNKEGFDHKLWFIPGWSKGEVDHVDGRVIIRTPVVRIEGPDNILRTFDSDGYSIYSLETAIGKHVEAKLSQMYPDVRVGVVCKLSLVGFTNTQSGVGPWYFRYSHGLRNSTSFGCQNIAHGHLSWLEMEHDEHYREECQECKAAVQSLYDALHSQWDGAVLIDQANVVAQSDTAVTIAYTSQRGAFHAIYDLREVKVKILPTETTVENLVEAFVRDNGFFLERAHIKRVYMSEGLAKGSIKELNHE